MFGGDMMGCYECTEVLKGRFNGVATDGALQARDEFGYLIDCNNAQIVMDEPHRAAEFGYKEMWEYF